MIEAAPPGTWRWRSRCPTAGHPGWPVSFRRRRPWRPPGWAPRPGSCWCGRSRCFASTLHPSNPWPQPAAASARSASHLGLLLQSCLAPCSSCGAVGMEMLSLVANHMPPQLPAKPQECCLPGAGGLRGARAAARHGRNGARGRLHHAHCAGVVRGGAPGARPVVALGCG
jgi:hypothetical protein